MRLFLLACLFGLLVLGLFRAYQSYQRRRKIQHWKNHPGLIQAKTIFDQLYAQSNGFQISVAARETHQLADLAYTYGEVDFYNFVAVLDKAHPCNGDVFLDCGAGNGKAVFIAALCYRFAKAVGLEILPELYEESLRIAQQYYSHTETVFTPVEFLCCDFLSSPWPEADIIFLNAVSFIGENWENLITKLEMTKPHAKIILAGKELKHPLFDILYQGFIMMSWGSSRVTIYQKNC